MKLASINKIIDLSVPVTSDLWEIPPIKRSIVNHKKGADLLGRAEIDTKSGIKKLLAWLQYLLGNRITHKDFPDKKGLSLMQYSLTTHTGTHMDAPYHYGDVDINKNPMATITDIPLDWCFKRGILINVSSGNSDEPINCNEIKSYLYEKNIQIKPYDIVLLQTKLNENYGTSDYFSQYRGISKEALEFLLDKDVKIIGIDSFSFDKPFYKILDEYKKTKNKGCLWPAHFLGRKKPYCQLERLTNLNQLQCVKEFWICCFPIKLLKADAAWCRVVALVNETFGDI